MKNQTNRKFKERIDPTNGIPYERFLFRIVGLLIIGGLCGLVKLICLFCG